MSKEDLLNALYERNYRIVIELKDNSKFVSFNHPYAVKAYEEAHCYSKEWTDEEIRKDVVYALLKWSGLKITYALDY